MALMRLFALRLAKIRDKVTKKLCNSYHKSVKKWQKLLRSW